MSPAELHRIRPARLPEDKPALLGFIMGMQHFEKAIEADRRTDPSVADEFYAVIIERVAKKNGCILLAEDESGKAIGWAAAYEDENEVYVHADERLFGYISELYVVGELRGRGIGRALIAACEGWAIARGLKVMMLGALARNTRAQALYRDAGFADYATMLRKYLR